MFRYSFLIIRLGIFFLIITRLLRRIKEAPINETIETMHKFAYDLQQLKATYQQSLEQQASTDPLANNMEIRKFFFTVLEKEMKTMNKMLNSRSGKLIFGKGSNSRELNERSTQLNYKELARRADAERSYDLPGKRHNDFKEISSISIIHYSHKKRNLI